MKRRRFVGLTAVAGCAPLAACSSSDTKSKQAAADKSSGGESSGEKTSDGSASSASKTKQDTLVVWVDGTRYQTLKEIGKKFSEKHQGVTVKVVKKNFEDIAKDFTTQVPTGKGPDIAVTPHDGLGHFVKSGVVSAIELGDLKEKMSPEAVAAFTQDGQCYGLPYAIESLGLVRNNKLTKSNPTDWKEAISDGKKAGVKYPFLLPVGDKGNPYNMFPFQSSFGNTVFALKDNKSFKRKLTIGDKDGVTFANWLHEQGKTGKNNLSTSITADIAKEQFLAGHSPYFVTGPWDLPDIKKKKIDADIISIPSAGGKTARPFLGVQGFILSSKSKNMLLATEFLVNYLGTKDVQVKMFEDGNRLPALKAAAHDRRVTSDKLTTEFGKAGKHGIPMPSFPEMDQVFKFWGGAEAQIISGKDPAKTWSTMTKNIRAAIKKAK